MISVAIRFCESWGLVVGLLLHHIDELA